MKAPALLLAALAAAGCATTSTAPRQAPPLSAARILEDVRILSSDAYRGRGPAQAGERPSLEYLVNALSSAGLQPGGENGSWYQDVQLLQYDRAPGTEIAYRIDSETVPLALGRDVTASSRIVGRTRVENAPLVFAGYGVNAPAAGWDDYEGVNMRGKIAVVLANDPDFEAEAPGRFGGRAMTYPGRFGAKVEEAQRQGAVGILVVHEDAPASYPWSQVANSDPAPGFGLAPAPNATPSATPFGLRGWLHRDRAVELFRSAGLDFEAMKRQARQPGFRAVPLGGATLSANLSTQTERVTSRNVVARLPGTSRPDETILYGAHWDAYGIGPADARGDRIRNGAIDNAVGTATLLDIARAFARGPRTERSLVFAFWTAEEKGLLGAE